MNVTTLVMLPAIIQEGFMTDIITINKTIILLLLPPGVFIVMHPNFENTFGDANFITELLHQTFIALLHFPPQPLRKTIHLLLLLLTELRPVSLLPIWPVLLRRAGGFQDHQHVRRR